MRPILPAALLLGFCAAAMAQGAGQSVIVTAPALAGTLDSVTRDFVQSYAAPAPASGKLSRWRAPICPRTDGLSQDSYTAFVSQRIRAVAAMAGAALASTPCKPNIEVVFTDDPQGLLKTARARGLAGYQGESVAGHVLQAWYVTGAADLDGKLVPDEDVFNGGHVGAAGNNDRGSITGSGASTSRVTGTRLNNGLSSEFINILVIADRGKTASYPLGPIADDIAMMALAQTRAFDACGPMPSITNLTAAECDRKTDGLTDGDLAYLKGLYRMAPDRPLRSQQADIMAEMKKELTAK